MNVPGNVGPKVNMPPLRKRKDKKKNTLKLFIKKSHALLGPELHPSFDACFIIIPSWLLSAKS
jgi:hypothetical protein